MKSKKKVAKASERTTKRKQAKKEQKSVTVPVRNKFDLVWLTPTSKESAFSKWRVYSTNCGRYQAIFSESSLKGGDNRFVAQYQVQTPTGKNYHTIDQKGKQTYPVEYKTLEDAMEALERLHIAKEKVETVTSNREQVVTEARAAGETTELVRVSLRMSPVSSDATPETSSEPAMPKAAKEKPASNAAKKPRGVGVIATILECLRTASKKKPVSKEEILKRLIEAFPDRQPQAMKSTISSQIPSGLKVEKGIIVQGSNEKGWWVE